jgi:hypothetical protein
MKTWLEGLFRKGWHRIVAETPPEKHERAAAAHESVRRRARERSRNAVAHDMTESSRRRPSTLRSRPYPSPAQDFGRIAHLPAG